MVWMHVNVTSLGAKCTNADTEYHIQIANNIAHANRTILCDKNVAIHRKIFSLFHAIVTPVACFGTGPMAIHSEDLQRLDIYFQKLLTSVVGPPLGISWDAPWHYIVHAWHERVADFVREIRICTWTAMCVCSASIGFCKLCCRPSTRRCGKFYRRGIRPAAFDVEDLRTFGVQNSLDFIDTRQWNIGRMMGKKYNFG